MTTYTVTLHSFHGGRTVYQGYSEAQAVRAARKHDCTRGANCVAGPTIRRIEDDGREYIAYEWEAARPFCVANEMSWIESPF